MKAGRDESADGVHLSLPRRVQVGIGGGHPCKMASTAKANPIAQINARRACPARRKTHSKLQAADGLELLRGSLRGSLRESWTIRGICRTASTPPRSRTHRLRSPIGRNGSAGRSRGRFPIPDCRCESGCKPSPWSARAAGAQCACAMDLSSGFASAFPSRFR